MKRQNALTLALLAGLATTACTTPPRRPRGPMQQPIAKEGQKVPTGEIQTSPMAAPATAPQEATETPQTDIPALWSRVTQTNSPLSDEELMKATQLYPTQPNSLEEAVFVVTQMRMLKSEWEKRSSFQTQDLHTQEAQDNSAGLSLERTFAELQIDLASVVRANTHLKNHAALLLAKKLLSHTKNSDSYRAGLLAAIREKGAEWTDLMADDAPATPAANTAPSTPVPNSATPAAEAPAQAPTGTPAAAPATNLDLMGSDTLLIAAQKLADKRDYKGALDHVTRIKKEDPFYAQAQEKIKIYSTRAVKDLRAKAAESFSNAAPLNDTVAKSVYLRQAKTFLEQALNDYPQADGLDSVKDNLEAVNRQLETSENSGT